MHFLDVIHRATFDHPSSFGTHVKMEDAFNKIRELAAENEESRRKAMVALQDLAFSMENEQDTIHRYGHMV